VTISRAPVIHPSIHPSIRPSIRCAMRTTRQRMINEYAWIRKADYLQLAARSLRNASARDGENSVMHSCVSRFMTPVALPQPAPPTASPRGAAGKKPRRADERFRQQPKESRLASEVPGSPAAESPIALDAGNINRSPY